MTQAKTKTKTLTIWLQHIYCAGTTYDCHSRLSFAYSTIHRLILEKLYTKLDLNFLEFIGNDNTRICLWLMIIVDDTS